MNVNLDAIAWLPQVDIGSVQSIDMPTSAVCELDDNSNSYIHEAMISPFQKIAVHKEQSIDLFHSS